MPNKYADSREALYLLSIELIILYLVAFGLLALKTDTMFSFGIAYPAVLVTFLLAYMLPALALLCGILGFERGAKAAISCALGAAVFVCVAFLVLAVLVASLWASPLVCVYDDASLGASAECFAKGDAASMRIVAADVRFAFPSRAQFLEHAGLANATVADVFLKSSLTENDWLAKVHAIVALCAVFILLAVQSSFLYAIYGATHDDDEKRETVTGAELASLFVRCALLLLCVVVDSADIFSDWNVTDVGPQMLPSLAFTCLLILADFGGTIVETKMETRAAGGAPVAMRLRLLVSVAETAVSSVYALLAILVACHYLVGGFAPLSEMIVDTRMTSVNVLFVFFLLLDSWSVFVRALLKVRTRLQHHSKTPSQMVSVGHGIQNSLVYASEAPAFGASIDLKKVVFVTEADKKSR